MSYTLGPPHPTGTLSSSAQSTFSVWGTVLMLGGWPGPRRQELHGGSPSERDDNGKKWKHGQQLGPLLPQQGVMRGSGEVLLLAGWPGEVAAGLGLADQSGAGGCENRMRFRRVGRTVGSKAQRWGVGPPGTEPWSAEREGENNEVAGQGGLSPGGPGGPQGKVGVRGSPFHLRSCWPLLGGEWSVGPSAREGLFSPPLLPFTGENGACFLI